MALALGIVLGALALCTGSASAVLVQLHTGRTLSYQPLRGSSSVKPLDSYFSNLDYNGGSVMSSNTNYAFYWDPSGASAYPAEYQSGIDQYFEDLGHDSGGVQNVDSVSTQYNDAAGEFARYESHFGGAVIDTNPYPANGCKEAATCLTDAQLQAELSSYISSHGLPTGLSVEYFMLTPPNVEDCFEASGAQCSVGAKHATYCAYHSAFLSGSGEIVYANDPYVTGNSGCDDGNHPNGKPSDGVLEGGLSHEHNESITDPLPTSGWANIEGGGAENGDKCRTFTESSEYGTALGTTAGGAKYNQLINGHPYWYQQEWSNQGSTCLQRLSFSGDEPTASFTSTAASGDEVSFDASASSAPGGVLRYNWQFNDGTSATETSAPTVSHSFAASGTYTVALTVFASDGTSLGTAQVITVGQLSTPSITKVSPRSGPPGGGTSVTITGSGFAGTSKVSFGSTPAASFTVNSSSSITAVSPPGTAGTLDITVTNATGTSATATGDHFKYTGPLVTGVSPSSGPRAGGTEVTVTGSGFALGSGTVFDFGKLAASGVDCTSTSSCTMLSPSSTKAATVAVRALVGSAKSKAAGSADLFTFN